MKRLLPLLFLLPASAHETSGTHGDDSELTYGFEALTGYRSEYVDRGFKLANDLIEIQLSGEIALSEQWMLEIGGWYGTETSSGSFDEGSGFLSIRYDHESWSTGLDASYHGYSHPLFEDGFHFGPYADWFMGEDWRIGTAVHYDTGADGWYGKLEAEWSHPTGRDSFVSVLGGISAVSDFYTADGWNDAFARLSWSYNLNRNVALTPFVGTSVALDTIHSNQLFGGLWLEVNF